MKNFALALLGLLFAVPFSPAETLDTVTFNPARLGQFERVKISDALNAPGGVKAQSVTVQSSGTVVLDNKGDYHVSSVQAKGTVNLPKTQLYSQSVIVQGGAAIFASTDTLVSSKIKELTTTPDLLKLKANVLKMSSLKVTGEGGQTYGGESLTGLKLGGNEIKPGNNCTGLQWVKRTASDNNVYQVLAMGTCGDASSECTPGQTKRDDHWDEWCGWAVWTCTSQGQWKMTEEERNGEAECRWESPLEYGTKTDSNGVKYVCNEQCKWVADQSLCSDRNYFNKHACACADNAYYCCGQDSLLVWSGSKCLCPSGYVMKGDFDTTGYYCESVSGKKWKLKSSSSYMGNAEGSWYSGGCSKGDFSGEGNSCNSSTACTVTVCEAGSGGDPNWEQQIYPCAVYVYECK